jgi:hypothetical protein
MIDTSTVSGVRASASAAGSTPPFRSTGRYLTWMPCSRCSARQVSKTAGCSLGDDLRWGGPVIGEGGATDGEVVGLGSGRGEHDVSCMGAYQVSELLPGLSQRTAGPLGIGVAAGRVAEISGQVRQRGLGDPWVDRYGTRLIVWPRPERMRSATMEAQSAGLVGFRELGREVPDSELPGACVGRQFAWRGS